VRFTVHCRYERCRAEFMLMREVALHQGEGWSRGKAGITIHNVSEYGLGKLEAEGDLVKRVERVT
jgi:hypothetical protein